MSEPTNNTTSHWQPMQDAQDLKILGKLLEELGELTSTTSRCLIQGIDETEPTTGKPNRVCLEEEVADVLACIDMLLLRCDLRGTHITEHVTRKGKHLEAWLRMATPR